MAKLNENYLHINESYLFAEIANRVEHYVSEHPDQNVIRLGIGDVTRPLPKTVVSALKEASLEQGNGDTFNGYGPEQGYVFLREKVRDYYKSFDVDLDISEIFISDGAKSDTGNITELFSTDNTVLVPDPVYPVYVDTNIMSGKTPIYMYGNVQNNFLPMPDPDVHADVIYLCSPNNPTGAVYSREQLQIWVDYALRENAVILFDAAYEAFVSDPALARSIFEIPGAKKCAIEFCSLSKTAGFTGTRCGYTVVPQDLKFQSSTGEEMSLNAMWLRRQSTKFNGTSYIVQKGAAAVFTPQGMQECRDNIAYYQENAQLIAQTLDKYNIFYCGGKHSPYIWLKCPNEMDSWDFFDRLLHEVQIVGTPGAGFGEGGKNFFRLTAFNTHENTAEAMRRFSEWMEKIV